MRDRIRATIVTHPNGPPSSLGADNVRDPEGSPAGWCQRFLVAIRSGLATTAAPTTPPSPPLAPGDPDRLLTTVVDAGLDQSPAAWPYRGPPGRRQTVS
jgi:hypothetical protein